MLLACHLLHEVLPVGGILLSLLGRVVVGLHCQSHALLGVAGTNVGTVAATQTVLVIHSDDEVHALHSGGSLHLYALALVACQFLVGHYDRTDSGVRTNECTLVTLDTVLAVPYGHKAGNATLLVCGSTLLPCTVLYALVCTHGQQVAVLCVDGTYQAGDVFGLVILGSLVGRQVHPGGIHGQNLVLATAVHGSIVHVHNVLTLLAVRLHDSLLHLLYCQFHGDNLCDAEECRLQDGVGAVAQTYLLSDLGSVDIVNGNVLLGEVLLQVVGDEVHQFLALEDGVQQELTAGLQTTDNIIHAQISLNVTCHEVGSLDLVCAADGSVAEAQV